MEEDFQRLTGLVFFTLPIEMSARWPCIVFKNYLYKESNTEAIFIQTDQKGIMLFYAL